MTIKCAPPPHPHLVDPDNKGCYKLLVKPELVRIIAYAFFWSFVLLTKILTNLYVVDMLAAGHQGPPETMGCGPFNRPNSKFGMTWGDGFDYKTENHLAEWFGFNNVCTGWDYTPSRELSSVYFPFFEYSLVVYIILAYINAWVAHKRGYLASWHMTMETILTFVVVFACIQFRQIFVNISYESPEGHTMGFLCLQLGLCYVAINNTHFVKATKQTYPDVGLDTPEKVAKWANIYLYGNLAISAVKIYSTIYIVLNGVGPAFYQIDVPGPYVLGQIVDNIWMFFNALLPAVIAYIRWKEEEAFVIEIKVPEYEVVGDGSGETNSLIR